jgi:hypothetical protein
MCGILGLWNADDQPISPVMLECFTAHMPPSKFFEFIQARLALEWNAEANQQRVVQMVYELIGQ